MKIYHLADVCTALECVCAVIIIGMAWYGAKPEYALCVFFVGEVFDALDGPLARRFHYPDDGKYRWWRVYAKQTDQLSDLFIGAAMCFYVAARLSPRIGLTALICATAIGLFVQTIAYDFPPLRLNWLQRQPKLGKRIVLARRWAYVGLIVYAIRLLLWSTDWPFDTKVVLTAILCAVGLLMFIYKIDRALNV